MCEITCDKCKVSFPSIVIILNLVGIDEQNI